jgi:hypothetical protein
MNKLKLILRIILFTGFLLFSIHIFFSFTRGKKDFINREYYGLITEIRTLQNSHDLPDIKINNAWISLTIDDAKVKNYIIVGDSIVKESGKKEIQVYRKKFNKEWQVKIFK